MPTDACKVATNPDGSCPDGQSTNVCSCKTKYCDGSGDDGNDACCGDGCPTHRNLEETLKSVPCKNSEGKCVNPKTQACYDYICAGPVDPKTSKCPSFTNVCPCGTNYNDDTKDDGSKACCGIGCPTHRNLAAAKCACHLRAPCQHLNDGSCVKRVDLSGNPVTFGGKCAAGTQDCHRHLLRGTIATE